MRGVVLEHLIDGQALCASMTGRAGALSGARRSSRLTGTARLRLFRLWCRCLGVGLIEIDLRRRVAALRVGRGGVRCLRINTSIAARAALPGRLAARRARAVVRALIEPFVGKLQVREQLQRESLQLPRAKRGERLGIELGQIVFAQLHGGFDDCDRARLELNDLARDLAISHPICLLDR